MSQGQTTANHGLPDVHGEFRWPLASGSEMRDSPWPLIVILPVLCGLPCSCCELVTPSEVILILLLSSLSSVTFYCSTHLSYLIIFPSNGIRINGHLLFPFEEITHNVFYVWWKVTGSWKRWCVFLDEQMMLTTLQIQSLFSVTLRVSNPSTVASQLSNKLI